MYPKIGKKIIINAINQRIGEQIVLFVMCGIRINIMI